MAINFSAGFWGSITKPSRSKANTDCYIKNTNIDKIKRIDADEADKGWFANPNVSRMFFTPTGQMLEQGSGYYQNVFVFFSNFAYGFTDHITASAGLTMIPWIGLENQLFLLTLKGGTEISKHHHVAAGISAFLIPASDEESSITAPYALYTYENSGIKLTGGIGGIRSSSLFEDNGSGTIILGG